MYKFFINRPIVAMVIAILTVIIGAVSMVSLPVAQRLAQLTGREVSTIYQPEPRVGDHIVYMSNLSKIRAHYPTWDLTHNLDDIVEDVFTMARSALQPTNEHHGVPTGHAHA